MPPAAGARLPTVVLRTNVARFPANQLASDDPPV